jgi:hypothetical protein
MAAVSASAAGAMVDWHVASQALAGESSSGDLGLVVAFPGGSLLAVIYGTLAWIGVGNVEGILIRPDAPNGSAQESLLLRGGGVGFNLPPLVASVVPVAHGDRLVFATDGVRSEYTTRLPTTDRPRLLAEQVLKQYAKGTDDALVLAAVFLGEAGARA